MKNLKIENGVKDQILTKIKEQKKGKTASIKGMKNINAIETIAEMLKIEIIIENPQGEYNGYGYTRLPQECTFPKTRIKNFLLNKTETKAPTIQKSEAEQIEAWCKRLSRLMGITMKEAEKIAEEKIDYKEEKIREVDDRQCNHYSSRRATLIRRMKRANPLRFISDCEHAKAILAASERHNNTDYDDQLDEARELADYGMIDKEDVRDHARMNCS